MTLHSTRRSFLSGLGASSGALAARISRKKPVILLRSSWQTVNIGDIGHTPGALTLLEKYFPEADVTLWPNHLTPEGPDRLAQGFSRPQNRARSRDYARRAPSPRHQKA